MRVKVVCFDRLLQVLILKVLRREWDPRGGVQAVGRDVRTVRGCVAANTRENSIEVHCVSITFLLAFEWNRKSLRLLKVRGKFPPLHNSQEWGTWVPSGAALLQRRVEGLFPADVVDGPEDLSLVGSGAT